MTRQQLNSLKISKNLNYHAQRKKINKTILEDDDISHIFLLHPKHKETQPKDIFPCFKNMAENTIGKPGTPIPLQSLQTGGFLALEQGD